MTLADTRLHISSPLLLLTYGEQERKFAIISTVKDHSDRDPSMTTTTADATDNISAHGQKSQVWDIFVRLFHWALVFFIGFAWWTGEQGGEWMQWHMRCGYAVLGLVIFRLLWGFAGSFYARFRQFIYSPKTTLQYLGSLLQRKEPVYAGHNPLGGWAVVLLLLLCAFQAGSGLFANDDIFTEGPLVHLVGYDLSIEITKWHKTMFNVLLAVIAVHVVGVIYHQRFRKEPLVQGMITGQKPVAEAVDLATAEQATKSPARLIVTGLIVIAVSVAAVWGLLSL